MSDTHRLLHVSDIHFGRIFEPAFLYLKQFIIEQSNNLDLIVVSGDWTQRARQKQFQQAVEFINTLNAPVLSVPGNHDIPLYNVWKRLLDPYHNYRRFIEPVTHKEYSDDFIAAIGMSTVNRFAVADGKVKAWEIERAAAFFKANPDKPKVLVCHHPVESVLHELEARGLHVDLILSGHTHSAEIEVRAFPSNKKVVTVSCSTTTSNRQRGGEPNGLNLLEISKVGAKIHSYQFIHDQPKMDPKIFEFKF